MITEPYRRRRGDADDLIEGFYLLRRSGRVDIPIHIWFGRPADPDDPLVLLDRSPRWQVTVWGIDASDPEFPPKLWGREMESIADVWPQCARWPTTRVDHDFRCERAEWAEAHDPNDPFGTAGGKIDPMTATLPIFD